jgi:hypothetical protein
MARTLTSGSTLPNRGANSKCLLWVSRTGKVTNDRLGIVAITDTKLRDAWTYALYDCGSATYSVGARARRSTPLVSRLIKAYQGRINSSTPMRPDFDRLLSNPGFQNLDAGLASAERDFHPRAEPHT